MRKFLCMLMVVLTILMCAGCGGPKGETLSGDSGPEDEAVKITFNADFYDNAGDLWLSATGSTFNIEPNSTDDVTRYFKQIVYLKNYGYDYLSRCFDEGINGWDVYRVCGYYFYFISLSLRHIINCLQNTLYTLFL